MWLGHLLLFSILSFLPYPTNLLGHSPFSCKWLQAALCFPECVSSQTFSWEYDLQCNSLSTFSLMVLLPSKITALPFVVALSLLFHEQDDNLWEQNYSSVENLPCSSAHLTICFTCVVLRIFPYSLLWSSRDCDDSLCAWVTSTAEAHQSQRWTPEGMIGRVSQTPHNDTIRPWPLLIHFPVSE